MAIGGCVQFHALGAHIWQSHSEHKSELCHGTTVNQKYQSVRTYTISWKILCHCTDLNQHRHKQVCPRANEASTNAPCQLGDGDKHMASY